MKQLKILWQFSRPHTIIGSVCSIAALYILACNGTAISDHVKLLATTLIAALGCNVCIVGVNQMADVEMDKINKPYLPLAAGTLSIKNARIIVMTAALIALLFAWWSSLFYFGLIVLILLIGMAYSLPPLYLKQHHLPAALSITVVRGFLVNVGIYEHFQKAMFHQSAIPAAVWCLTAFIMAFSIAIAWFKDLPDTKGDAQYKVHTLAVLYSPKTALHGGVLLVLAAYVLVLCWSIFTPIKNPWVMIIAHGFLLLLFLLNYRSVKLNEHVSIKKFYLRFWLFFFAEYILFAVWAMLS